LRALQIITRPTGTREIEAALCFFKAMKVYPQPKELMGIYDKTVPKVRRSIIMIEPCLSELS